MGRLEIAVLFLAVFVAAFMILLTLRLPWWGALTGAVFAWFPITNQISLVITNSRRSLEHYFQPSPPNLKLPPLLEEIASASSWTDDQQKRLDELVSLADGELASQAIFPAQRLATMLKEGEPKKSISSYAFALIVLWKVARSEHTIATTRQELLAIATDLRRVEVRESS